ncbi:pilus assembly protein CpaB [Devosia enhydra]|uniref:Pilus assembly protein CpaB n=1 Tax=Devosia enhydra TaxID=665118 RepID=A0A1K2I3X6_9HYPH|nr:Flp pilus assembly protein CpaB [Devosia enhydra]SFZ86436.1 pilus assembly protein CpaB [Devosia enhydra]
MNPARLVLLLVAVLAGGLAAYLATRGDPAPPPPETRVVTEIVEEARTQILVASAPIGVGQRLSPASVRWQDWPEGALQPDYVTLTSMPDALDQLQGTMARFEFFPGEPIREVKLVRAEQGYLSAVLDKGKRGISITVSATSASGGFIVPNDRVDVVLTRSSSSGEVSETILSNVKVLAIGTRLGEVGTTGAPANPDNPRTEVFSNEAIATLELDPAQGELLINAASRGRLSLALRSMEDFAETPQETQRRATNQSIRVIRYGQESSVIAGTPAPTTLPEPVPADPSAYMQQATPIFSRVETSEP